MSRHGPQAQTATALLTGLLMLPVALIPGHDGPARASGTPGLAISVADGQLSVRPGQVLTYTARLRDTGTAAIAGLQVTQTLSAGLKVIGASDNGVRKARLVAWSTALPAGGTRTFQVTARVTKAPAQMTRVAAVACATLPGSGQPVVCAAHLDRLPGAPPVSAPASGRAGSLVSAATALALLAGCLLAILLVRRARPAFRLTAMHKPATAGPAPDAPQPSAPNTTGQ